MLTWAFLHLLGHVAGAWTASHPLAASEPPRWPADPWLERALQLTPALLAFTSSTGGQLAVWGACFAASVWGGRRECEARRGRRHATTDAPWVPSHRQDWQAGAQLRLTSWPRIRQGSWTGAAIIVALGTLEGPGAASGPRVGDQIFVRGEGQAPALWSEISGMLTGRPPRGCTVPGGFDFARHLAGRGIAWEGRLERPLPVAKAVDAKIRRPGLLAQAVASGLDPVRGEIIARLRRGLPEAEAQLAAAVLLGQRESELANLRAPFARLGLAHLFALSGLHVGIILALLTSICRPFCGPCARLVLIAAALILYAVLTGMSASVVRAVSLGILALSAPVLGRRWQPLHGIGVLYWLNCLAAPWCVLDTGLRLSYLAATGILAVHHAVAPRLHDIGRVWRWICGGALVSLSAQWFTLPEIAGSFGYVNPLACLANLIVVPVFSAALWLVAVAVVLGGVCPWLMESLCGVAWLLFRLLEAGAAWTVSVLPGVVGVPGFGPVRLFAFLMISAILWHALWALGRSGGRRSPGPALVALLGAIALALILPLGRSISATAPVAWQFDVGQGDCGLVRFPDGWTILIDTGPAWTDGSAMQQSVLPWLERNGIRRLDAVLLTHAHADHTGGSAALAERFAVGCWYLGGQSDAEEIPLHQGTAAWRPQRGAVLHRWRDWQLACLYPTTGPAEQLAENDCSVVLGLRRGGQLVAAWTGDLEDAGEQRLLRELRRERVDGLQFLKVGHHGSRTSGGSEFLASLAPRVIVISCGVENRHQHPSHGPYVVRGDTLPVLRTDLDGSIWWRWAADGQLSWGTANGRTGHLKSPSSAP